MDLKDYPIQYIRPMVLEDGTVLQLRPIHPRDSENADRFKDSLSDQSIYNRFFGYMPTTNEKLVKRLTEIDYVSEMAIIAEIKDNPKVVIAVARLVKESEDTVEFAIIIADEWQRKGLGKRLTKYTIEVAEEMGYENICATILSQNTAMLEILRKLDFDLKPDDSSTVLAFKSL